MVRWSFMAALALVVSACGGGGGEELAGGNSSLSEAQIDAALGPADQGDVQDAMPSENAGNPDIGTDVNGSADAASNQEDEQ